MFFTFECAVHKIEKLLDLLKITIIEILLIILVERQFGWGGNLLNSNGDVYVALFMSLAEKVE